MLGLGLLKWGLNWMLRNMLLNSFNFETFFKLLEMGLPLEVDFHCSFAQELPIAYLAEELPE